MATSIEDETVARQDFPPHIIKFQTVVSFAVCISATASPSVEFPDALQTCISGATETCDNSQQHARADLGNIGRLET